MDKWGGQPATEPLQLRLCSYNIHKGICAANSRAILPQLRHSIRTVNADMMFLQEVVGEKQLADLRSKKVSGAAVEYPQFEFLADEVWPHYAYGRNALYQTGHHSNAILSKYPFDEWDNTDVSHWRFSQRGILMGKLYSFWSVWPRAKTSISTAARFSRGAGTKHRATHYCRRF